MKNDMEMIVHKFSRDFEELNIYPLGDVHFGSSEFDWERWNKWKQMVLADPVGYVVIVGDILDNGLKNSKSNSYEQVMRPMEQKRVAVKELGEIKDRILGICRGNHEYRSVLMADDCPLYDIASKLDLEDWYRENMVFMKVSLGARTTDRQCTYGLVLAHGKSRNKTNNFSYAIDGMDIMVTGHTHQGESNFPSKIVMDLRNDVIREVDFTRIVVPSFVKTGGYALRDMYLPMGFKIPVVKLGGLVKEVVVSWI